MMLIMKKENVKKSDPEEQKFHESFGGRVRQRREDRGLTSEKLAELAGVSYQWISTIENGRTKRGVSLYVAYKVAKSLGTSIEDLIGRELFIDEDQAFELMLKARERKKSKIA